MSRQHERATRVDAAPEPEREGCTGMPAYTGSGHWISVILTTADALLSELAPY